MDKDVQRVIAELLRHSMSEVAWKYEELTEQEQDIVGDQEMMDKLRTFVEETEQEHYREIAARS